MWVSSSPSELKQLSDALGIAVFVLEVVGDRFQLLSLNDKHERATALKHEEVSGRFLEEIFPPELAAQLSANYRHCLQTGETVEYDERLALPGGPRHWRTTLSPIRNQDDAIVRIVGTGIDVTAERLATKQLKANEQRYRAVVEPNPAAIYTIDPNGHFLTCNEATLNTTGYSRQELIGHHYLFLVPPEDHERVTQIFKATLAGSPQHQLLRIRRKDGVILDVDISIAPYQVEGKVLGIAGMTLDITERVRAREALADSERQLRTMINSLPVGVAYIDNQLRIRFYNDVYRNWRPNPHLLQKDEPIEKLLGARFHEFQEPIRKVLAGHKTSFEREELLEGVPRIIEATYIPDQSADQVVHGFFVMAQDITERKRQERELAAQAQFDGLTGLYNRRGLLAQLDQAMLESRQNSTPLVVLFLDLDGFKQINDTYGHAAGDSLLQEVSRRLSVSLRKTDILARIAGDEFVILLRGIKTPDEVSPIAEKLLTVIAAPYLISDATISVTVSIGGTLYQGEDSTLQALLHRADQAMYQSKRLGKNRFALI